MELQPHIRLSRAMTQARYALLPGDPQRVEHVARFLEKVEPLGQNREFRALRGEFHGIEVLAISTGIGGASTAIAVEELRHIGITTLIRIGSCGALQDHMAMGDLVIASGAVRDEGTSHAYAPASYPACADNGLVHLLRTEAERLAFPAHCGYVRSHDSFYTDREAELDAEWSARGILAADMETAPLMVVGALRGLRTASVLNVVVTHSGGLAQGINDYQQQEAHSQRGEAREIELALNAIRQDYNKGN
ncbi:MULTISPECIES: nucleoside phosphorylase [Edwardsiella]|uniref:Uridine phosphorylase n=2 Tax=Edwardsiella anguillarum TaxID=1821960 RepID=A0A076LHZ5_9GAMM|nr:MULTISPECIES: nucleoside phosphorylase [Edwardsiella]AKM46854.1 uridine phosphorylase [Edwardsiella sp. EA181011]GAJ68125.1 N-ribosylnicotinamide phosphorylase [Edwardsiella piscicida]AIJ07671.1 N-Ribosylnicotinamide phosphorylase [Edwardsiella anguillarum ET080813]AKR78840.1 nucleoside phosphorylase [Edwardsiella sp. LADL05-105]KAB0591420.1 nucleoside phosphorylase [Edwardsiella anguillarum]